MHMPQAQISDRELEVLALLAEGKSALDVGEILGLSAGTVMFHYRRVAERYGTLNRTHTIVEAIRRGDLPIAVGRRADRLVEMDDHAFLP